MQLKTFLVTLFAKSITKKYVKKRSQMILRSGCWGRKDNQIQKDSREILIDTVATIFNISVTSEVIYHLLAKQG